MGRVDKNRVQIVMEHINNQRVFYKKDLDYLCALIGLKKFTAQPSNPYILYYFPQISTCKAYNSGSSTDSLIHELCEPGKFAFYWWNPGKVPPNRTWVLCEYHAPTPDDVKFMKDILKRKGYAETERFPPTGWEYKVQERGESLPYIFWSEPTTRDSFDDEGETIDEENIPDDYLGRRRKKEKAPHPTITILPHGNGRAVASDSPAVEGVGSRPPWE